MIRAELELGIDQNGRTRARARTIVFVTRVFVTRAELAQDFSARVKLELELELYCLLNEPSPNRQYPLRIGSFTPLLIKQESVRDII
jgi:hypothetical protein